MRQFLILFDDFAIDTASVKSGNNTPEVITAARCVNVGLFISGNLRRDVVVTIAKGTTDDLMVISFPGASLKRVSPDERSISFFLMKSISIGDELLMNSFKEMDNGIEVRRSSLKSYIEVLDPSKVYIAAPEISSETITDGVYENSLLIYNIGEQFESYQVDKKWNQIELSYFTHPERFILEVNMTVDSNDS
jgi:hypothetical protein